MKEHNYRAVGCLWGMMEATCLLFFIVFLLMKICGSAIMWITVFVPLIVCGALTIMLFLLLVLQTIFGKGDKDE